MIHHKFSKFLFVAGSLIFAASCTEKVNEELLEPPSFAEFGTSNLTGKYFITNSTSSSFKIPVGITNTGTSDRTIQFTYTSPTGAVAGTQYTAPQSVVIPAGKALDTLVVKGLFAGYPTGRKDTLRIKIAGGDVAANAYNNTYNLVMQKYCDVTLAGLGGDYNNTFEGTYGPYPTSIHGLVSTGATTATGMIDNLYDVGFTNTSAVFDWTDPAAFAVTIPAQSTGFTWGGLPLMIRSTPGALSTFSSCDNTVSVRIDIYRVNGGVAEYYQGTRNYLVSMAR